MTIRDEYAAALQELGWELEDRRAKLWKFVNPNRKPHVMYLNRNGGLRGKNITLPGGLIRLERFKQFLLHGTPFEEN